MNVEKLPPTATIYGGILLLLTFIIALGGNILVLLAISLYKKLSNKPFNLLIANISFNNLLICVCYLPIFGMFLTHYWPEWTYGSSACYVLTFLKENSFCVVTGTFLIMALHAYNSTFRGRDLSFKIVLLSLFSIWLLSLILNSIYGFEKDMQGNLTTCQRISFINLTINQEKGVVINTTTQLTFSCLSVAILSFPVYKLWYKTKNVREEYDYMFKRRVHDVKLAILFSSLCPCFCFLNWMLSLAYVYDTKMNKKLLIMSAIISYISTTTAFPVTLLFSKYFRRTYLDISCGFHKSILRKNRRKKNSIEADLARNTVMADDVDYTENGKKPIFTKGKFVSNRKNTLTNVSIETIDLISVEQTSSGQDNVSYEGENFSNEITKRFDSKF